MTGAYDDLGFTPSRSDTGSVKSGNSSQNPVSGFAAASRVEQTAVFAPLHFHSYQNSPTEETSQSNNQVFSGDGSGDAGQQTGTFALPPESFEGLKVADPARKRKIAWIVSLSILALLIVLIVSAFFTMRWYFQDRVSPGVTFGNQSVLGQNKDELMKTVNTAVSKSTVTLRDNQGHTVAASLQDLGVNVDVNATVNQLIAAKNNNVFARLNPFMSSEVGLVAKVDKAQLNAYLTKTFVDSEEQAVPANVTYNKETKTFTAVDGKKGRAVQAQPVEQLVDSVIAQPGEPKTVSIQYTNVDMPISFDTAKKAATDANARMSTKVTVSNGDNKTFDIPPDVIAGWITPTLDPGNATISLVVNKQAISSYMANELPKQLNREMVSQVDIVNKAGTVLVTSVEGIDGVTIKNTGDIANQVFNTLTNGQPADIKAQSDVVPFTTTQKESDMRIVVDKSSQTASVYKNDQLIKTFNVCTGSSGSHETDNGTFYIYLTYAVQDMTGLNDDGSRYLSKGVKWVSYFNGGEGFHTASWNYNGIAVGDPAHNGSHGCVNMYEQDAQWIYDNCPKGSVVQVIGTQPTGPVR